jgi:YD repeat-containing protein
MGRATQVQLPAYTPPGGSQVTPTATTTYNPMGLPLTQTDPLGNVTTFTYDPYGRVLTKTEPDPDAGGPKAAPAWAYTYTRTGQRNDTVDPTGAHSSTIYDALGRPWQATADERVGGTTYHYTTIFGYDDASNLTTVTTPRGKVTTTTFNKAGSPCARPTRPAATPARSPPSRTTWPVEQCPHQTATSTPAATAAALRCGPARSRTTRPTARW